MLQGKSLKITIGLCIKFDPPPPKKWVTHLAVLDPEKKRFELYTLPETNIFAPENGWLEYDPFLLGFGLFSGATCS